jgi:hypothetical protein
MLFSFRELRSKLAPSSHHAGYQLVEVDAEQIAKAIIRI